MVFQEVRFCEMLKGMYGHTNRSCSIVIECSIEQWFTRRWCNLSTVGVACSLYLVRDCHDLYCEGVFPWTLWVCGCDTQL